MSNDIWKMVLVLFTFGQFQRKGRPRSAAPSIFTDRLISATTRVDETRALPLSYGPQSFFGATGTRTRNLVLKRHVVSPAFVAPMFILHFLILLFLIKWRQGSMRAS